MFKSFFATIIRLIKTGYRTVVKYIKGEEVQRDAQAPKDIKDFNLAAAICGFYKTNGKRKDVNKALETIVPAWVGFSLPIIIGGIGMFVWAPAGLMFVAGVVGFTMAVGYVTEKAHAAYN